MVFSQELSILLVGANLINCDLILLVRGTCASPICLSANLILGKLPQTKELGNLDNRITLKVVMVNNGGSRQCYVKIFEPISQEEDQYRMANLKEPYFEDGIRKIITPNRISF